MGYKCTLKANKDIQVYDVQSIINDMPDNFKGPLSGSTQSWGWSCACDVSLPNEEYIDISGSYSISGNIAEDFVAYFKDELERKGYNINISWDW